jgi:activating signal cointegrator complex subunit 3
MMLPVDAERTNNKQYEEVNIPVSEPVPVSVGNNLVPISSLDEVRIFLTVTLKQLC